MFTPEKAGSGEARVYPKFADGEIGMHNVPARISLIVDLGTQPVDDFEEEYKRTEAQDNKIEKGYAHLSADGTKIISPQKPCRQVVYFADLVADVVDYGGDIGEKPYRIMLNKSFMGNITGTNLKLMKPRDPEGKIIQGREDIFPPKSLHTRIANAVGVKLDEVGNDIRELAGKPFLAEVENKAGKGDAVYTNFKNASTLIKGMRVDELPVPAECISFEEVTREQVQFLRKTVRDKIKNADEYEGSPMQAAIEAAEAEFAAKKHGNGGDKSTNAESSKKEADPDDVPF